MEDRSVDVPRPARLAGTRWFRFGRPYYAKPLTRRSALDPAREALALEVAPVRIAAGVRRRARARTRRLRTGG
ncbi:hypothetical protein ABZ370_40020 [Streptomyces sp. NPDC005962]|uniref:hypothetical protein n=1 Tax=Streptomyces sp. NPDC005962 TaxID=3154466 RepID=UPI0033C04CBF